MAEHADGFVPDAHVVPERTRPIRVSPRSIGPKARARGIVGHELEEQAVAIADIGDARIVNRAARHEALAAGVSGRGALMGLLLEVGDANRGLEAVTRRPLEQEL